jgi:uroporphyrinogen-III decarboxylase
MLDMFRRPEQLLAMIERVLKLTPRSAIEIARRSPSKIVFIPLHWGLDGFMSPAQFATFYWPSLRRLVLTFIDAGLTPCVFWEGDCTSRLEVIKDIPRGKCIYFFERTDIFKAKKILGDTVCIRGGVPASLLVSGTPAQVADHCKRLIDEVGRDGGYIVDASVGIPDEARHENVRAMFETTREYGVYR